MVVVVWFSVRCVDPKNDRSGNLAADVGYACIFIKYLQDLQ